MKKLFALLMVCLLACLPIMAQAQDVAIDTPRTSITSGLPTNANPQIFIIQMDNEPGARPQMGIASADIVYETEVYNGGYTRYSAVFNDTLPVEIEAMRSARLVHADIAMEYGGWFVHYGGQDMSGTNVFDYIKKIGLNGIDCLKSAFGAKFVYRDSKRSAPNNVVLKLQEMRDNLDWSGMEFTSPLKFDAENYTQQGEDVSAFSITYRDGSYEPSYVYNADEGVYYRYYNGKNFNEGLTGEQITCENVIIMRAEYSWYDGDSDRPVVDLFGSNTCEYFINGKHFTGTWQRDDVNDTTTYLDADGNEVIFKPGTTYIQVLSQKRSWQIDG